MSASLGRNTNAERIVGETQSGFEGDQARHESHGLNHARHDYSAVRRVQSQPETWRPDHRDPPVREPVEPETVGSDDRMREASQGSSPLEVRVALESTRNERCRFAFGGGAGTDEGCAEAMERAKMDGADVRDGETVTSVDEAARGGADQGSDERLILSEIESCVARALDRRVRWRRRRRRRHHTAKAITMTTSDTALAMMPMVTVRLDAASVGDAALLDKAAGADEAIDIVVKLVVCALNVAESKPSAPEMTSAQPAELTR